MTGAECWVLDKRIHIIVSENSDSEVHYGINLI